MRRDPRGLVIAIRPLEVDDLPLVARLWDIVEHEGSGRTDAKLLVEFLQETLLASPWFDPEIPSLVATDGSEIVGFIGSNVRRMRFDGRPVRMACSAHLLAHPSVVAQAVGARLLYTYLDGPQDLTVTDSANEPMRKLWRGSAERPCTSGCVSFVQLLRPGQLATHRMGRSSEAEADRIASSAGRGLVDRAATRFVLA